MVLAWALLFSLSLIGMCQGEEEGRSPGTEGITEELLIAILGGERYYSDYFQCDERTKEGEYQPFDSQRCFINMTTTNVQKFCETESLECPHDYRKLDDKNKNNAFKFDRIKLPCKNIGDGEALDPKDFLYIQCQMGAINIKFEDKFKLVSKNIVVLVKSDKPQIEIRMSGLLTNNGFGENAGLSLNRRFGNPPYIHIGIKADFTDDCNDPEEFKNLKVSYTDGDVDYKDPTAENEDEVKKFANPILALAETLYYKETGCVPDIRFC